MPGNTFIFFDETGVDRFGEFEVFTEALLLEITNSELISKCEEMMNSIFDVIILQHTVCHQVKETKQLTVTICEADLEMVHEMGPVALHLFVAGDGTENNLGESLTWKHSEADATNGSPILHQGQSLVFGIEDKPND